MVEVEEARSKAQDFFWAGYRPYVHTNQRMAGLIPTLTLPFQSHLAQNSTAKLSHARIIRGYRGPDEARNFHELMKEKTA